MKMTICSIARPTALVIIASLGVFMMCGCADRRSEQHRLEGDAYFKLHKVNEAAEAYKKADLANPNNALAKLGLGRCATVVQQYDEALAQFQKAYEVKPDLEAAYVEAANVMLKMNRFDDAVNIAKKLYAVNPERGGVLEGSLLTRTGRAADAAKLLSGLRDKYPQSVDLRINLATGLLSTQQPDAAEKELREVLEKLAPDSVAARMVLADVFQAQGKTDASIAELRKLSEKNPEDQGLKLALARGLANGGKTDEAQALAKEVLGKDPGSGWANFVVGCCLLDAKKTADALPYLQAAEQALPGQPDVARRLAAAKAGGQAAPAGAGKNAQTAAPQMVAAGDWRGLWRQSSLPTLLRQKDDILAKDESARETLIVAALVMRSFGLVDQLSQGLQESSPLRGIIDAMKQHKPEDLLKRLDDWKEQDPERQILHENTLGVALAGIGARTRAFQILAKSFQTWPENVVCLYNIALMFQEADMTESASKTLQRVIATYPGNSDAHVLLFGVLRSGGMGQDARNAAEAAYSLFPNTREVVLSLCQAYMETRDPAAAKRVLERAIKTAPDDAILKIEWAVLLSQTGDSAEAVKSLDAITVPPQLEGRANLVRCFAAALADDWTKVSDLLKDADPAKLNLTHRLLLTAAKVKAGQNEEALKTISAGETSRPSFSGRAREIAMKSLGGSSESLTPQEQELADTLSKDPEALNSFLFGAACQAAQLYEPSYETFRKLDAKLGYHPQLLQSVFTALTKVRADMRPKDLAREITDSHADNPIAWVGLAMVMRSLGDTNGEREALVKAMEKGPNEPDVWFQEAQYCERSNDLKGEAAAYKRLSELRPDDPSTSNNLAYSLLVSGGDLKEALDCAQKAKEKLANNPAVLHTLGVAQLRSGMLEESRKNLSVALEMRPGDPTLMLDYGLLLIAEGKADDGKHHIELAIKYADQLGFDFPRKPEAQQVISQK